jgi:5'-methylthioadenosine phosphorylase
MATPYCQELRGELSAASRALGIRTHQNGTVAVIQGPRFSTIAESRWFARQGWDLVNMTQYPECYFAREAGLCYAVLAMITDYDVGVGRPERFDSKTSIAPILRVFHQNISNLKALLPRVLKRMPTGVDCGCSRPLPQEYYKQENSARKTT